MDKELTIKNNKNFLLVSTNKKGKSISIGSFKTSFKNVDDLVKLKKKLIDRALTHI